MKWFSVEWSKREFTEQKQVELVFCASDQIRSAVAELNNLEANKVAIHSITEYDITVVQGGYC